MSMFVIAAPDRPVSRRLRAKPARRAPLHPDIRWRFIALLTALSALATINDAHAERSVTLAWNPSTDSAVVGYQIQTREENSTPTIINVGGRTKATVPGLKEGLRYTFTVTSYTEDGLESAPSNPAEFVVPVPLVLVPGATAGALKRLQFPMAPGHWYELQASSDLKTWNTIWQTGITSVYAWTEFQDPLSGLTNLLPGTRGRFYRLVIH